MVDGFSQIHLLHSLHPPPQLFPAIAAIAKPAEDWTPYATALIFEVFSDDSKL